MPPRRRRPPVTGRLRVRPPGPTGAVPPWAPDGSVPRPAVPNGSAYRPPPNGSRPRALVAPGRAGRAPRSAASAWPGCTAAARPPRVRAARPPGGRLLRHWELGPVRRRLGAGGRRPRPRSRALAGRGVRPLGDGPPVRDVRRVPPPSDAAHPQVALAVRGGRQRRPDGRAGVSRRADSPSRSSAPGREAAPGGSPTSRAVQRGAVRGAEVGDRDPAVRGDRHRAVQPGDVRVVQRDVGVGGAADPDLAAVQQMDPARVGPRDHVQLGRGGVVGVAARARRGRWSDSTAPSTSGGSPRAQRWASSRSAPGVQHDRARRPGSRRRPETAEARRRRPRPAPCPAGAVTSTSQPRRARRSMAAARREDGQPDLHRRQRSLLRGVPGTGTTPPASPHPARTSSVQVARTHGLPRQSVLEASSHLPLTTRPAPSIK